MTLSPLGSPSPRPAKARLYALRRAAAVAAAGLAIWAALASSPEAGRAPPERAALAAPQWTFRNTNAFRAKSPGQAVSPIPCID